ncbi:MAG TPA: hypothetical protein VH478_04700 [Trebonia sp.]|jgi:ABC-type transport system involved in multi-copper enzyme maturation permease subunit|nr:hypothetical protein [Trebonia sp.]
MTTLHDAPVPAAPPSAGPRVPLGGLLLSEWTKIRTVRSTVWSLIAFAVVTIGASTLIASLIAANWNSPGNDAAHTLTTDPTSLVFGPGFFLGQLALGVLGVIVVSGEYSTGAIRSSLLAVPGRLPMLAAKIIVFALLEIVISAVMIFVVFFITTSIFSSHVSITISQPGMVGACIGAIFYLTVVGLFAMSVGGLIRHTAGAIATVVGIILVVPSLIGLIPGTVAQHISAYFFTNAGVLVAQTHQQPGDLLSPWQGLGVFVLEVAILLAAGAWLLKRRDA